ncbi:MAG: protein kinase [Candidatus Latescibacterota bacterium]|nr:MAG: protein kinase [Candidatus Latescibacterota bacterium]
MSLWERISDRLRTYSFGWPLEQWTNETIAEEDRRLSRLLKNPIGGRYRVEDLVFDQCFRAVDENDGSLVILKILSKTRDPKNLLGREFEICSGLSHKNIIKYHDILTESDFTILVARYFEAEEFQVVAGPPVEASLSRDSIGLSIFHQLQDGLDYLHGKGIVHAGLRRDSVLLDTSGDVTIIGLLHSVDSKGGGQPPVNEDHQRLMYGSPEHLSGELTPESDYFAIGILLFEYLLRVHPFWRVGLRIAFARLRESGADKFLLNPQLYNKDRKILGALFSPDIAERRQGWGALRELRSRR